MVHSGDVLGTLASAAFGNRWRADVLNIHLSWKLIREDLLYLVLNFPTPNALLFLAGSRGPAQDRRDLGLSRHNHGTSGLVLPFCLPIHHRGSLCVLPAVLLYGRGRDRLGRVRVGRVGLAPPSSFGGASPTLLVAAFSRPTGGCVRAATGGWRSVCIYPSGPGRTSPIATITSISCGPGGPATRGPSASPVKPWRRPNPTPSSTRTARPCHRCCTCRRSKTCGRM